MRQALKLAVRACWILRHSRHAQEAAIALGVVAVPAFWQREPMLLPAVLLLVPWWLRRSVSRLGWARSGKALRDEYVIRMRWRRACLDAKLDQQMVWPFTLWRGWTAAVADGGKKKGRQRVEDRVVVIDVPRIRRIEHGMDTLTVYAEAMSQPEEAWTRWLPELAGELGLRTPACEQVSPRTVSLTFPLRNADPEAFTAETPTQPCDLRAVPLCRAPNGSQVTVPVLGSHIFVAGATRSGKSGFIWALLQQLAPHIKAGSVQPVAIDPKLIELGLGRDLFARFVGATPGQPWHDEVVLFFREMVALMDERKAAMYRDKSRKMVEVSPEEPLLLIVVEELLSLVKAVPDRRTAMEINNLMTRILAEGAALGFCVVTAAQIANKLDLPSRSLVPVRFQFRATEAKQVQMCLGDDAISRGALAHKISDKSPGVGYASIHGQLTRFRIPWVDDATIEQLVLEYGPPEPQQPDAAPVSVIKTPERKPSQAEKRRDVARWLGANPDASVNDIMDRFGVSQRTAYRYLNDHPREVVAL